MRCIDYTIMKLDRGVWRYFIQPSDKWTEDLYFCTKYNTHEEAQEVLNTMIDTKFWGGYFKIEEYTVSR